MRSKIQMKTWHYLLILPILGATLFLFSFKTYPVYAGANGEIGMTQDTFPPIPDELIGKQIDTIITFDPVTKTETVEYVESIPYNESRLNKEFELPTTGIDTLVIFDPETGREIMATINYETMEIDTIQ